MTSDAPKRRGRPPVAEAERKASNLTFRTRGGLRAQLEEAAQESGRSISEEIEHRLQIGFDRRSIAMHMYGSANEDLMDALNYVLNSSNWLGTGSNSTAHLAAITILLASAEARYDELIEKNADPSSWSVLSQVGIARARKISIEDAEAEAERLIPEMAHKMTEYRAGREMALGLKKERKE